MSEKSDDQPQPQGAPAGVRKTFTGRTRRSTRVGVKIADWAAGIVIRFGGIAVVGALAAMVVYLFWQVIPLFQSPTVEKQQQFATNVEYRAKRNLTTMLGVDEAGWVVWTIDSGGVFRAIALPNQKLLSQQDLGDDITASNQKRSYIALGYADGTVRLGRVVSPEVFITGDELKQQHPDLEVGDHKVTDDAVLFRSAVPRASVHRVEPQLTDKFEVGDASQPITHVDYFYAEKLESFIASRADGRVFLGKLIKRMDFLLDREVVEADNIELPVPPEHRGREIFTVLIGADARQAYVVYLDGTTLRFSALEQADDPSQTEWRLVETADLTPDGSTLKLARWMLGNTTILVGDSSGRLSGWFPARYARDHTGDRNADNLRLVRAHELEHRGAPAVAIGTSYRDRQVAAMDADGTLWLYFVTTDATLAKASTGIENAVAAAIAPRNDAIAVLGPTGEVGIYRLSSQHPGGSMSAMFGRVHYEGYPEPGFIYQSTGGQPKLSMIPLIFGTLKATFYAMLIGLPIAILSAIYSSEFMHPRVRTTVKSTIEMMASLPSVVLGFMGALLIAPVVENHILGAVLLLGCIPLGVSLFAYLWQLLPNDWTRFAPSWAPFAIMVGAVLLTVWVVFTIAPGLDRLLFGDFKSWLADTSGKTSATPGWGLLLSPVVAVTLGVLFARYVRPRLAALETGGNAQILGFIELLRFILMLAISVAIAFALGSLLNGMGFDPRGELWENSRFIGAYQQRNALLVGVFMGFAIVPIVYTVSEDALSSVPNTLRSASLGAGATPWQTATRVVFPVAMSGIFSACMIGLGRAAGETMIVLMISGNSPLLDFNVFEGLSALSANIATEIAEPPVGSTLQRVLFFSGLLLFAMTFVINTIAEVVRARFRKRAYQL